MVVTIDTQKTIFTFFGIPRLVKMVNLQYLAIRAKVVIFLENYIQRLRVEMFLHFSVVNTINKALYTKVLQELDQ